MTETDESRKMLVIGVAFGALIGILGNLWVGALLNFIGKDATINSILFVLGFVAWVWAIIKILKMIPLTKSD